jgi:hypothetical protein
MKLRYKTAAIVLLAAVLLFDPFSLSTGFRDNGPYAVASGKLSGKTFLTIASYDDYFDNGFNDWVRNQFRENFIDENYDAVLDQASLGNESFSNYLHKLNVQYLVVPVSTANRGQVFHRFSIRGSIALSLENPYFQFELSTGGEYPIAIFKVLDGQTLTNSVSTTFSYQLNWSGIRSEFASPIQKITNDKFARRVSVLRYYEDGESVTYSLEFENPEFIFETFGEDSGQYESSIALFAAYGPTAPPQVVKAKTTQSETVVTLQAGELKTVKVRLKSGDSLKLERYLTCTSPIVFDPANGGDPRKLCFGVADLSVRRIAG